MESKSSLKFSFCGGHEVDALSVSCTIASLVEISKVIAEREYPDVDFKMSVRAVQPGSLEFDFVAFAEAAKTIFTKENVEFAFGLIGAVSSAFTIKEFLKGKKPEKIENSGDKISITREDGNKIQVPKEARSYFSDSRIDQNVTSIVKACNLSDGITGISVETADNHTKIEREDFEKCSEPIEIDENNSIMNVVRKNETLFVRQASFTGDLKWKFQGDQNITATISDSEFMEKVSNGKVVISAKTYLVADVHVTIYLDPDGTPSDARPTYEIIKVHEIHTVGERQLKLDT